MAMKKPANTEYQALKEAIRDDNLKNLYLLWGEETYLLEHYFSEMKALILSGGFTEFNHKRMDGKNLDLSELSAAIDALPAFAERTLIEVRDFDIYKCGEDKKTSLTELLRDLPSYCHLVFVCTEPGFKPDSRTKLHSALTQVGSVVEFEIQEQSALTNWIRRRFLALGHDIGRSEAEHLIFTCGSLMTGLISETEKVAAYSKTKEITKADIDAVAVPILSAVVFKMTDAISRRDFDGAFKILGELVQMKESPIMILAMVGRQVRQLYSARLAIENKKDALYLKHLWGMRSDYPAKLLLGAAKAFSAQWCKNAVTLCAETDLQMKSSSADDNELLTLLILKIAYA